jgi:vacuolar protein sorting-associated protein 35
MVAKSSPELGVRLYLEVALAADHLASLGEQQEVSGNFSHIAHELISQACKLHEQEINEPKSQLRCIVNMAGTIPACQCLSDREYEGLITKVAQYSARLQRKQDQCQMVAACAHLFYPEGVSQRRSRGHTCQVESSSPGIICRARGVIKIRREASSVFSAA